MARAENPLFQPIIDQNLASIEYLIRQGVDVNQANEFGLTPLEFAIRSKSVASAQLLLRYGASFDLIEVAVIEEFRFQPGIGPFIERYALANNPVPVAAPVAAPRPATTVARSVTPPRPPATPVSAQAITTQPVTTQPVIRQTVQNQLPPQQTITVSPNRQQPVPNTSFLASSSNANNLNAISQRPQGSQRSQATIGVTTGVTTQKTTTSTNDTNLNGVLENVLNGLDTAQTITVSSSRPAPQATSQIATQPVSQAASQVVPQQAAPQQSIANNGQILAMRQPSQADALTDIATTPTVTTPQETVALLPTPATAQEVKPEAKPTVKPQEKLPQAKPQQVHYDNPSQSCSVNNYNLVVSFTFDDGEASDLAVINEIFKPRQVTGTLGIILNRLDIDSDRYMQVSDLRELYRSGWEIASHTIDHDDLTSLDKQDLDNDLLKSHKGLGALGFDVSSLVYPYGANNKLVRDHTSKYYYGAFEGGYRLNTRQSNPFKLKRFHIAEAHDFNYYKRVTDAYSDEHGWLVWAVHTNLNFGKEQVDDMHQLLDYMCDQGIRVVNAREGLDHLNLVDYR